MTPLIVLRRLGRFLLVLGALHAVSVVSAAERAYTFKHGVNLSHWLSQNYGERTYAAAWFGEADIVWIAQQGFDHVRLPVDVRLCVKPDGSLDETKLKPIADCIAWCKSRGLGLVLDAHFLPGADFSGTKGDKRVYTDAALQEKVAGVWRDLARRFAGEGPWLRFEILNEPVAAQNEQLNPFMRRMLAAIRETNPTRIVYVTSNKWSSFLTVASVVLPEDPNVALTLHDYDPMIFTHQRASWVGFKDTLPPVTFPGTVPDCRPFLLRPGQDFGQPGDPIGIPRIDQRFQAVAKWVAEHRPGLEVYLGEFGVYQAADPQSKMNWIRAVRRNCEQRGWGWAVWDYKGGFAVRAPDGTGTPILQALFGPE